VSSLRGFSTAIFELFDPRVLAKRWNFTIFRQTVSDSLCAVIRWWGHQLTAKRTINCIHFGGKHTMVIFVAPNLTARCPA
jgi:hypothetical protein